jgi:hypothetical protein
VRGVREFMAEIAVAIDRAERAEASGFVVLVIDTEGDSLREVVGPFSTPEDALLEAGRLDADPHRGTRPADGEPGWRHVVLPLYPPDDPRPRDVAR